MTRIIAVYRTDPRTFRILFPALALGLIAAPFAILTIGAIYHG